ncbi:hypothetical protein PVL30_002758 [Lodderomyces elongisporus]|uniref:uncharacterized protein n=1 Tax=Lodderomyces elongisporus TaxID=36914 RepID=UPI00291CF182|nr:uncharacterized protein PVL30_002758 [Lodderomyces elongisporus]WLF79009.1 hypothetical protein PVL30_002758 [Lodderomyces elongisporus]
MDDTDKPDPILKQVPLIKNPSFQPPKPVTLNSNYSKLIPTLPNTVIPPKLKVGTDDINSWSRDIQILISKYDPKDGDDGDREDELRAKYQDWLQAQTKKVAPGFDYNIMTPQKTREPK